MSDNVRPESMKRINTPELAEAFINEQVEAVREQVEAVVNALAVLGAAPVAVLSLTTRRERRQEGIEVDIPSLRIVYHGDTVHRLPERTAVAVVEDTDVPRRTAVLLDAADDGFRELRRVVVDDDYLSHTK